VVVCSTFRTIITSRISLYMVVLCILISLYQQEERIVALLDFRLSYQPVQTSSDGK